MVIQAGRALASCYEDVSKSKQAKAKLRRLLACQSTKEVCNILRPLLSLIESKSHLPLDFSKLLSELMYFQFNKEKVKAAWAQDFYRHSVNTQDGIA
jgi:CRISPR system Cascade subunit CasB